MFPDDQATSDSNPYSELLLRGVSEVRTYQLSGTSPVPTAYTDSLIARLERTATLPPGDSLDQAIDALGRIMVDEFPLTDAFAPSISQVLDAQQRVERQRRRIKSNATGNA